MHDEDHRDRNPEDRRVRQRPLGSRPYRWRHHRARRDVLRRRRRRGAHPRHAGRAAAWPRSAAYRGDSPRHGQPADGAVVDGRGIPGRLGHRHRAVGPLRQGLRPAGAPDARRALPRQAAHLQHLRRLPLRPLHQHQAGLELEPRRGRRAVRGSRRLHEPRRRARREPAGERHHGDENLAVRSRRDREPGPFHHAPRR